MSDLSNLKASNDLRMSQNTPRLVKDAWWHILHDKWMWIVVWGKQRTGKTTLQMKLAHWIYKDWDLVLQSFVWNLAGLMYRIRRGEPQRILTLNKLHDRVPILLFDDWGATSNKATTQYDRGWDVFKGAFDVLGTHLSILCASMVDPTEPTFQLQMKYTHEVWLPWRGCYKYDQVDWQQDFSGWRPKQNKRWIETNMFGEVPRDVYKEYDEMRLALVDEVFVKITDAMAESQLDTLLKRLQPNDIQLLELLQAKGAVYYDKIGEELGTDAKDVLVRCKSRNLIVPLKCSEKGYYKYDLTEFAYEVLDALKKAAASTGGGNSITSSSTSNQGHASASHV